MERQFNPDLILDYADRGHLVQMSAMQGYQVMHRIFRSEVDKFFVQLINARPAEPQEVLTAQLLAKAAAQFYKGITDRINEEIIQYSGAIRTTDRPIDATEGLLDLDAIVGMQSFLEDYE